MKELQLIFERKFGHFQIFFSGVKKLGKKKLVLGKLSFAFEEHDAVDRMSKFAILFEI